MIKEKSIAVLIVALGVLVAYVLVYPHTYAQGSTTTVSATVATTVTCTVDNSSTALGTLSSGSISTASPNVTVTLSCNYGGGCILYVNDAGNSSNPGLYASAATGTPLIASADATLSAGTEGYGIQAATSSNGTGAALAVNAKYLKTGNAVGGLLLAATGLASSTLPSSGKEIVVTHKAAIGVLTKAGTYSDTITYSCSGQ
jgi:hypothetical protein